jgi:hypothetical protein
VVLAAQLMLRQTQSVLTRQLNCPAQSVSGNLAL